MQSCLRLVPRSLAAHRQAVSTVVETIGQWQPRTIERLAVSPRSFSTTSALQYVVVDHSEAYEAAMQGPHGKQLALARLEGEGKDVLPFDPFAAEELDREDGDDEGEEEEAMESEWEEFSEDGVESMYNADGSIRRNKSVLATLEAGFPAGGQFAIFELGGAQHKVTTDDVIVVNRLKPVDTYKIGSVHTLKDIMLVGSSHKTLVGVPFVAGAEVDVMVEEITRDAKVIVFKKRRRKHSQRKNGFRRDVTLLRVLNVRMPGEYRDHTHVGRDSVKKLERELDAANMAKSGADLQSDDFDAPTDIISQHQSNSKKQVASSL